MVVETLLKIEAGLAGDLTRQLPKQGVERQRANMAGFEIDDATVHLQCAGDIAPTT